MDTLLSFFFDIKSWLPVIGYIGTMIVVYVESGLIIGVLLPLPGDSLLFTAGLFASHGMFSLPLLYISLCLATVVGAETGYWFGVKYGVKVFNRPKSLLFNQEKVEHARAFFEAHGPKSILIARFIPAVRTLAPIAAGVAMMDRRQFRIYNALGSVIWVFGLTTLGYYLGETVPNIDHYILPIIAGIVILSLTPLIITAAHQYLYHPGKKK
jgi:membrane-associated protein